MYIMDREMYNFTYHAIRMIDKFNPTRIHFLTWLNRLEFVAEYIGVPNSKLVPFICLMTRSRTLGTLVRFIYPLNPYYLPYQELISAFCKYFAYIYPFNSSYVARLRFIQRVQYEEETVEKYSKFLHKFYNESNYPYLTDRKLLNQFKHGLRNKDIAKVLDGMPHLKYRQAVNIATCIEKSEEEV